MAQTSVKLHPLARAALGELKRRLEGEIGLDASREDIVGALVCGATTQQLFGMVLTFKKQSREYDDLHATEQPADQGNAAGGE